MERDVRPLRYRVDPGPVTALVALGDLLCIAAFVVAGELSHGIDPVSQFPTVADTYVQFALGWVVAAPLVGLYAADARRSAKRAVALTVPAWISAALVAQMLRATSLFRGSAAVTFFLVSVAVGLALLLPWRVGLALLASRRS